MDPDAINPNENADPIDHMTFEGALSAVKSGKQAYRAGWNGKGRFIEIREPDMNSDCGLPYLRIMTVDGNYCPWLPSQTDILANDWAVLE